MKADDVRQYVGQKVLLDLSNGLRFTTTIPDFEDNSFNIIDKFGQRATINCDLIMMVYEKNE